ncbi:hypothetical protein [Aequorivita sp. KMM 9714]|uniref:hypothetical protein n=1 Tax=Aequorivita sp. KMM 9714 TaxID=2707173 RepID=UPI0013ECF263|nr:hypothetical protein [Aequorivita sp. KMM 9714]NGX85051.1 hypothetical protein [Aequorivita sp. KMM 9714]
MKRPVSFSDEEGNYKENWVSIYKMYFPRQDKVKIDWFSGILIIPYGKLIEYVHQSHASTYSNYWLLEIENGVFNEAREYNYKDFVNFKNYQFEVFKKTEDYKNLNTDLKRIFGN